MTRAEALELARKHLSVVDAILAAVAAERENCARVAERWHVFKDQYSVCASIAAEIRARGQEVKQ